MGIQQAAKKQLQAKIDATASSSVLDLFTPKEGWIASVRKALGMSGAQLAKRLDLSRARIFQAEKSELEGGITLRTMQEMAEAMGCKFVYAIVPETGNMADILESQAKKKATVLVETTSTHMALEKQALSPEKTQEEIKRLMAEFLQNPKSDLWNE